MFNIYLHIIAHHPTNFDHPINADCVNLRLESP
jgi:hypothetical protein